MIKVEVEKELRDKVLLLIEFRLLDSYYGIKCKTCGIIQGYPHDKFGIEKYYCKHYYGRVNRKMKPYWEKAFKIDVDKLIKQITSPIDEKENKQW